MEHLIHLILGALCKLLNDSTISKFVTRKLIEVNGLSGSQCSVNKNIKFKTPMLRANFFDYSDTYIVIKETIDFGAAGNNAMTQKVIIFKNNTPFMSGVSKINNTFVDNAEDLDFLMSNIICHSIVTIIL